MLFQSDPQLIIITGHYGAGKTSLVMNIIVDFRTDDEWVSNISKFRQGEKWASESELHFAELTLIDLDIVNPYFRSSDRLSHLKKMHTTLLGPVHATNASNLDTPSLQPGIDDAIRKAKNYQQKPAPETWSDGSKLAELGSLTADGLVLIDVGGDPDGARALGRYKESIIAQPYQLVYVINFKRPQTATVELAYQNLRAIEETSGLKVTSVFCNTHLMDTTTANVVVAAALKAEQLAQRVGVPLVGVAADLTYLHDVSHGLKDKGLSHVLAYPFSDTAHPWFS